MIAFVFLIFAVTFSNAAYGVPAPTETAAPVPVDTPKPAEPIVPQPETCKVKPGRSQEECQTASEQDDTCERCSTTACLACRTLYNKLCTQPEVFASAQECLNKYAETASAPGHSDEETRGRCRKGLAKLCADQVCVPAAVETPKPAYGGPAPAQPETCKVQAGRSQEVCQAESEQDDICQKCGTSACGKCRSLYVQLCTKPEIFTSAQECLNKYAETATAPGHTDEDTRGRCRKGLAKLCADQVCAPAAPPAQPETCKVQAGRSQEVCQAESEQDDICQKCGTSACGKCRSLYVQLCTKPEIFTSAQECLNKYAETATAPGHTDEDTRGRCRKGLAKLCASQVCATTAPAQPETCKVKPGRSEEECQTASEQDDTCERCSTTACLACRTLYKKLCTQPEDVRQRSGVLEQVRRDRYCSWTL